MTIRKTALTMAFPLVLLCTVASAQSSVEEMMQTLDADGSGTLSESEAAANEMIIGNWDALDADSDGQISTEELAVLAQ